jgi:hypothetical protein
LSALSTGRVNSRSRRRTVVRGALPASLTEAIVHLVAYHPRRTTQPVQYVDQSWPTSGLGVDVLTEGRTIGRVYLAPGGEPLDFEGVDGYTRIALPPVAAHAMIILE